MPDIAIKIGDRNEVVLLNEYNNEFSIISAYEGNDGNNYFNMMFPRNPKTKQPREKAIPQKVKLGDQDQAVRILKQFISALESDPAGKLAEDDIPF